MQIAFLDLLFTVLGFITDGCYARRRHGGQLAEAQPRRFERYVSGIVFRVLGLTAAYVRNQRK